MLTQQSVNINHSGLADYPAGATFGPRVLNDYEFVWIERGDCIWEVNNQRISCPPGTVILCRPGMRDRFIWDPEQTTRHGFIHFEPTAPHEDTRESWPTTLQCADQDVLRPLLRHVVWLLGGNEVDARQLATASLEHALNCYLSGLVDQNGPSLGESVHPALERAFYALRTLWNGSDKFHPPKIKDWATAAAISRGHFIRICVQELGVTPQQLLRHLRLEHSIMLLRRTNMSVAAVSDTCGFANPYHYSRCCRETYGISPREVRTRMRRGQSAPSGPIPGLNRIMMQLVGT